MCPAVGACASLVVAVVEEYFLSEFGFFAEIVMPYMCRGGALRVFYDFSANDGCYDGYVVVLEFDTLAEFVYNAAMELCGEDPFGASKKLKGCSGS